MNPFKKALSKIGGVAQTAEKGVGSALQKAVTKVMSPTVKAGQIKDAQMSAWSKKAKSGELN